MQIYLMCKYMTDIGEINMKRLNKYNTFKPLANISWKATVYQANSTPDALATSVAGADDVWLWEFFMYSCLGSWKKMFSFPQKWYPKLDLFIGFWWFLVPYRIL